MATYTHKSLSLNAEEVKQIAELKKKGFGVIDIFRAGLAEVKTKNEKKSK